LPEHLFDPVAAGTESRSDLHAKARGLGQRLDSAPDAALDIGLIG